MGFLDNSRDIIVDAVLTDAGRRRLAEGLGGFKISKFALGDDEINYRLYDINHPSGSAYYDLDILQTPVFEAFTNNISTMNSKLVSYSTKTLLYLPVIKLNDKGTSLQSLTSNDNTLQGGIQKTDYIGYTNVFLVSVDSTTTTQLTTAGIKFIDGKDKTNIDYIRVDQGLDNNLNANIPISTILMEDAYTVEIDNRFGYLNYNNTKLDFDFVDDDDVAAYNFFKGSSIGNVNTLAPYTDTNANTAPGRVAINGSRGTCLHFGIHASMELQNGSDYWFDKLGVTDGNYKIINSTVTVTGIKTGYSIDIPVSFIKYVA